MKREIKFRAWDRATREYWNIDKWHFEDEYLDLIEPGVSICDSHIKRIWRKRGDVELMQYTGLDDVNGNPIYEGDIVKAYRTCKSDLITFDNGSFGIALDDWHSFESFTDFYGKCEVIGNKFQNPELLEVTE